MKLFIPLQLTVIVILSSLSVLSAQEFDLTADSDTHELQYQKVLEIPGMSAADLFKQCKKWVASTYKQAANVEQSELENEMLSGRGNAPGVVKLAAIAYAGLGYNFKIDFKDGRIRYTVYNMEVLTQSMGDVSIEYYVMKKTGEFRKSNQSSNVQESVSAHCNSLFLSLKDFLTNSAKKDDW